MRVLTIEDCIQYFAERGMKAYEDDGSVYLKVDTDIEVQLSSSEVLFRAEEYQNENA